MRNPRHSFNSLVHASVVKPSFNVDLQVRRQRPAWGHLPDAVQLAISYARGQRQLGTGRHWGAAERESLQINMARELNPRPTKWRQRHCGVFEFVGVTGPGLTVRVRVRRGTELPV